MMNENLKIKDVKKIWAVPGSEITDPDDIEKLVESPLVSAVKILFHKGIKTYWSTANAKHSFAGICIEPKALSPANLDFAKTQLGFTGRDEENILLDLPITPYIPVKEVETYFINLANQFADQK